MTKFLDDISSENMYMIINPEKNKLRLTRRFFRDELVGANRRLKRYYDFHNSLVDSLRECNLPDHIIYEIISKFIPEDNYIDWIIHTLWLYKKKISNLEPLNSLKNLRELRLDENQIKDLRPLKSLTNLRELELNKNQIVDLRPLKSLTNLTYLDLSQNQIVDLEPLKGLYNLKYLCLSHNRIRTIDCLEDVGYSLIHLDVSNNSLSNINFPYHWGEYLHTFDLSDNNFTEFLQFCQFFDSNVILDLRNNPGYNSEHLFSENYEEIGWYGTC